jgi:ABC-type sugar transport system ATPase subunit
MKEIFDISDTVTVLRDGKYVGTEHTKDITRADVVNMMIGRKLEEEYIKSNITGEGTALEVKNLTKKGVFKDISLNVQRGEILGIFGLMGSGRSEFFEALFGAESRRYRRDLCQWKKECTSASSGRNEQRAGVGHRGSKAERPGS